MRTRMTNGFHLQCKFLFISSGHLDSCIEEYKVTSLGKFYNPCYITPVMSTDITDDVPIMRKH